MKKFDLFKSLWKSIRTNWKTKYRLLIQNESNHENKLSFLLSPRNIVVVVVTSAVVLIMLTAMLIAFTPLRVYVPGYTTPAEYRLYKQMANRADSVERLLAQNQQYIDNFYNVINGNTINDNNEPEVVSAKTEPGSIERNDNYLEEDEKIRAESDVILGRITQGSGDVSPKSLTQRADIKTIMLFPPAMGALTNVFNIAKNHYGIDIKNERKTPVTCVADGMVIFAGFDPNDGNIIIVQHPGNIISIYKHNDILLKNKGARVSTGEPIAEMGSSGLQENGNVHLHFELWYNGFPVNPLDYLVVK